MRDAEYALEHGAASQPSASIEQLEWSLTDHIHGPTGYRHPGELAAELLTVAHGQRAP
jgi:hypothetical protein